MLLLDDDDGRQGRHTDDVVGGAMEAARVLAGDLNDINNGGEGSSMMMSSGGDGQDRHVLSLAQMASSTGNPSEGMFDYASTGEEMSEMARMVQRQQQQEEAAQQNEDAGGGVGTGGDGQEMPPFGEQEGQSGFDFEGFDGYQAGTYQG